jgi:hypothetical protein
MKLPAAFVAACVGALALVPAHLAHAADPAASASRATHVAAPAGPDLQNQARRDIGCIGYRGRSSGVSRNGKCIARKKNLAQKN